MSDDTERKPALGMMGWSHRPYKIPHERIAVPPKPRKDD